MAASFGKAKSKRGRKTCPKPRADIAIALRVIGRCDGQQRLAEARWGKDARATDTWVFDTHCPTLPDGEGPTTNTELDVYREKLDAWEKQIAAYRGYHLDLRGSCLQGVDLSDLCLSGVWLQGARMEGANLSAARMEGAYLSWARMEGADLTLARMEGADLSEARMEGANLSEARMAGTNLSEARMEGADLSGARMEGAFLSWARMEGAGLSEARMDGAYLRTARFDSATFWAGAKVSKAHAQGVDFAKTPISTEQVNSMFGDASVTLPNDITPTHPDWPAHWPKEKLDWRDFDIAYKSWLSSQP